MSYCENCSELEEEVREANKLAEFFEAKFNDLREVVKDLYYAAHWKSDNPTLDEDALWEAVRDVAKFEKGKSPKRS